jgi:Protein of Unknown function (DUF2784)
MRRIRDPVVMGYRLLADGLVLIHGAYIAFVVLGSLLALWRRWVVWLHLPAVAWGVLVEFFGWVCPLTPWEQALRVRAGQSGYAGGFIEHYLVPMMYPADLTRAVQVVLGALVLIANAVAYGILLPRLARPSAPGPAG